MTQNSSVHVVRHRTFKARHKKLDRAQKKSFTTGTRNDGQEGIFFNLDQLFAIYDASGSLALSSLPLCLYPVCLPAWLSVYLGVCLPGCLCVCLPGCLGVRMPVCLCVCVSVCLPVVCLCLCLCICVSACLCLSVCLSVLICDIQLRECDHPYFHFLIPSKMSRVDTPTFLHSVMNPAANAHTSSPSASQDFGLTLPHFLHCHIPPILSGFLGLVKSIPHLVSPNL